MSIFTNTNLTDLMLQIAISKHVSNRLPVIGVENPAYDPRHKNGLPKLCLNDESWCEVVESLIAAAEIIIIFYERPSPSINTELDMVRRLGRQNGTIIVRPAGPLVAQLESVDHIRENIFPSREQSPIVNQLNTAAVGKDLADFPFSVSWDETSHAARRLKKAIASIPRPQTRAYFSKECPAPLVPQPPERVKLWAHTSTMAHKLLARMEATNGNLVGAEDHLTVCLATTFFGDDGFTRADMFLQIANIQWLQGKLAYATDNLERALDLMERLPPMDYATLLEFSANLQQYRYENRVETMLKRITVLHGSGA